METVEKNCLHVKDIVTNGEVWQNVVPLIETSRETVPALDGKEGRKDTFYEQFSCSWTTMSKQTLSHYRSHHFRFTNNNICVAQRFPGGKKTNIL